jgi:hypothetical protein
VCDRLGEHAGPEKGDLTGPNPVDRGKYRSKVHLITDRAGLPLSVGISGANVHDSQTLISLVQGIPPIRSRRGLADAGPESSTPTRATTTCGNDSSGVASSTGSPSKASKAHKDSDGRPHTPSLGQLRPRQRRNNRRRLERHRIRLPPPTPHTHRTNEKISNQEGSRPARCRAGSAHRQVGLGRALVRPAGVAQAVRGVPLWVWSS